MSTVETDADNYRIYRELAKEADDAELRRCAEKAAMYYSDAYEGAAVGMRAKAAQYRRQAKDWERRYWDRFHRMGLSMRELVRGLRR